MYILADSKRHRLLNNEADIASMGGRAIGQYGEGVAENHLRSIGRSVVSSYCFKQGPHRAYADFFEPSTGTAFEVKTVRLVVTEQVQIRDYLSALRSRELGRVVFILVQFLNRRMPPRRFLGDHPEIDVVVLT